MKICQEHGGGINRGGTGGGGGEKSGGGEDKHMERNALFFCSNISPIIL